MGRVKIAHAVSPPSMATIEPVAKVAASLARNSTGPASSAVLAMRRCGQVPGDDLVAILDIAGDAHGEILQHVGIDPSGADRIHPDVRGKFLRQTLRHVDDTGLRGTVGGAPHDAGHAVDRRDVHDVAPGAAQVRNRCLGGEERALEVGVDDAVPQLFREVIDRGAASPAGIVDEHIKATETFHGGLHHRPAARDGGHRSRCGDDTVSGVETADGIAGGFRGTAVERHPGARLDKGLNDGAAYSSGPARDKHPPCLHDRSSWSFLLTRGQSAETGHRSEHLRSCSQACGRSRSFSYAHIPSPPRRRRRPDGNDRPLQGLRA